MRQWKETDGQMYTVSDIKKNKSIIDTITSYILMVTDRKWLNVSQLLSYPNSRDAITSKNSVNHSAL